MTSPKGSPKTHVVIVVRALHSLTGMKATGCQIEVLIRNRPRGNETLERIVRERAKALSEFDRRIRTISVMVEGPDPTHPVDASFWIELDVEINGRVSTVGLADEPDFLTAVREAFESAEAHLSVRRRTRV